MAAACHEPDACSALIDKLQYCLDFEVSTSQEFELLSVTKQECITIFRQLLKVDEIGERTEIMEPEKQLHIEKQLKLLDVKILNTEQKFPIYEMIKTSQRRHKLEALVVADQRLLTSVNCCSSKDLVPLLKRLQDKDIFCRDFTLEIEKNKSWSEVKRQKEIKIEALKTILPLVIELETLLEKLKVFLDKADSAFIYPENSLLRQIKNQMSVYKSDISRCSELLRILNDTFNEHLDSREFQTEFSTLDSRFRILEQWFGNNFNVDNSCESSVCNWKCKNSALACSLHACCLCFTCLLGAEPESLVADEQKEGEPRTASPSATMSRCFNAALCFVIIGLFLISLAMFMEPVCDSYGCSGNNYRHSSHFVLDFCYKPPPV